MLFIYSKAVWFGLVCFILLFDKQCLGSFKVSCDKSPGAGTVRSKNRYLCFLQSSSFNTLCAKIGCLLRRVALGIIEHRTSRSISCKPDHS